MKIANRRATFDYEIKEKFEAGINLYGAEVKAIRLGHADLTGSYVRIIGTEAYLVGASIFPFEYARPDSYDQKRTRKLLLHKKQLFMLKAKMDGGNLTIVPLSLYTTSHLIKLEIALAKGKKLFEKKESKKKKDIEREIEENFKIKIR